MPTSTKPSHAKLLSAARDLVALLEAAAPAPRPSRAKKAKDGEGGSPSATPDEKGTS